MSNWDLELYSPLEGWTALLDGVEKIWKDKRLPTVGTAPLREKEKSPAECGAWVADRSRVY